MLETFGVSIGSEAVYRAMLQHPDQDLKGLALTLGRRVEEVRAALDDLGRRPSSTTRHPVRGATAPSPRSRPSSC